jgi:hypothetical protein
MKKNLLPPITLKSVQQAFAEWRRRRKHKRSRIPEELLEQAAAVCQLERPTKVARQLRLSYAVLKKYLDSGEGMKGVLPSTNQEFIEVALEAVRPSTLNVEIQREGKETIRFSFSGVDGAQIREIVKLFL